MNKELVAKAIEGLKLGDIYLFESSVRRFDSLDRDHFPQNWGVQQKLSVQAQEYQLSEKGDVNDSNKIGNLLKVKVSFGVRFVDQLETKEEPTILAQIEATFLAEYTYVKEVPENAVNEFLEFNVIHNTWPFWREFVFQTSDRCNLPKPEIPLMTKVSFSAMMGSLESESRKGSKKSDEFTQS